MLEMKFGEDPLVLVKLIKSVLIYASSLTFLTSETHLMKKLSPNSCLICSNPAKKRETL